MKKSRIIIPALAMIAFSVAASITGTVAWFTANRTANINAGTYAVVKTTANLACDVSDGEGTTATNNTVGQTDVIQVDGKLTDGSFDHLGSDNYITSPDVTGTKVGGKVALASATETNLKRGTAPESSQGAGDGYDIYTAVTWNVTFSIEFGAAGGDIGLYLDLKNSSFTAGSSDVQNPAQETSKGFRMAFIPKGTTSNANNANGNKRVFADLQTNANCSYVAGSVAEGAALAGTAYTSPYLIDSATVNTGGTDGALPSGYTAAASANLPNYFGKFVFAANTTVSLDFTVVCWFEGSDPNIVNGDNDHKTAFKDVTVALEFAALNFLAA